MPARSSPVRAQPILSLVVIAWALMRYGRTLPVGKFFAYSSALIAVLCVVLAGKGVSALQEAGWLPISPLAGLFRVDVLGLYPTSKPSRPSSPWEQE